MSCLSHRANSHWLSSLHMVMLSFHVTLLIPLTLSAACGILVPRPGIEPMSPALKVQNLKPWTIREVPTVCIITHDSSQQPRAMDMITTHFTDRNSEAQMEKSHLSKINNLRRAKIRAKTVPLQRRSSDHLADCLGCYARPRAGLWGCDQRQRHSPCPPGALSLVEEGDKRKET